MKGSHENVFRMEFEDKVELLKEVGALTNGNEISPDKPSKARRNSENYIDGEVTPPFSSSPVKAHSSSQSTPH